MTKGELRRARKLAKQNGQPLVGELALDHDQESRVEFSPETLPGGLTVLLRVNVQRERALERHARLVYDHDRDFD